VLAPRPTSGLHAVSDDGSEGLDRVVLVSIKNEDGRAIRGLADDVNAATDIEPG
jgi:hypothetical protein